MKSQKDTKNLKDNQSAYLFIKIVSYTFVTCAVIYFGLQIVIFINNPSQKFLYYVERIGPGIWMFLAGIGLRYFVKKGQFS